MVMKKLKTPYAYIINTVVLAAILVLGNMLFSGGALNRATKSVILQCGVYSIMAVSLNICTGYLGQLPLGHAGFMAVGAYAGALFWKAVPGLPTPVAIVCGILIAGLAASLFGVIIGVPALRLKGDYLAIVTLAFGEIGLAGEIRAVSNCEQRIAEAQRLGFTKCIIPFHNYKSLSKELKVSMDIVPVRTIRAAFEAITE